MLAAQRAKQEQMEFVWKDPEPNEDEELQAEEDTVDDQTVEKPIEFIWKDPEPTIDEEELIEPQPVDDFVTSTI